MSWQSASLGLHRLEESKTCGPEPDCAPTCATKMTMYCMSITSVSVLWFLRQNDFYTVCRGIPRDRPTWSGEGTDERFVLCQVSVEGQRTRPYDLWMLLEEEKRSTFKEMWSSGCFSFLLNLS